MKEDIKINDYYVQSILSENTFLKNQIMLMMLNNHNICAALYTHNDSNVITIIYSLDKKNVYTANYVYSNNIYIDETNTTIKLFSYDEKLFIETSSEVNNSLTMRNIIELRINCNNITLNSVDAKSISEFDKRKIMIMEIPYFITDSYNIEILTRRM